LKAVRERCKFRADKTPSAVGWDKLVSNKTTNEKTCAGGRRYPGFTPHIAKEVEGAWSPFRPSWEKLAL